MCIVYVFFFKQKTAYEMRISDWSSDVCSSDLRREVGHGNLAMRSLKQMMPETSTYAYTVRVVSDILESNGSSSMATVCAGSLALMDAGVPIPKHVSGDRKSVV